MIGPNASNFASAAGLAEFAANIARLIGATIPEAQAIEVASLAPMFGGNARKAWSFDLNYRTHGEFHRHSCVMLCQQSGRQIETDIEKEFKTLRTLNASGARVPAAFAVDADGAIVGSPSVVLERLPGKASAVDFLNGNDIELGRRLTSDLADSVAQLHTIDVEAGALDDSWRDLSSRALAACQVEHWYETFLAQRMEPMPVLNALFRWLRANLPEPPRICLVHGDLRPGNFLYEGDRVTGLLDWEMVHFGDPVEDLGWIYRPMWSPERFMPQRQFVERYSKAAGYLVTWKSVLYYRIFSELKFAVISITASRSFVSGRSKNLRHLDRAVTVAPCLRRSLDWIELHDREPVSA